MNKHLKKFTATLCVTAVMAVLAGCSTSTSSQELPISDAASFETASTDVSSPDVFSAEELFSKKVDLGTISDDEDDFLKELLLKYAKIEIPLGYSLDHDTEEIKYHAWAEIIGIGKYPETDPKYYATRCIRLALADEEGRTHYYIFPMNDVSTGPLKTAIKTAFSNDVKFLEMKTEDGTQYALMQDVCGGDEEFSDVKNANVRIVRFFVCESHESTHMGQLAYYTANKLKIDGKSVSGGSMFAISDSFEYVGGTTFCDNKLGYEITFDYKNYKAETKPLAQN